MPSQSRKDVFAGNPWKDRGRAGFLLTAIFVVSLVPGGLAVRKAARTPAGALLEAGELFQTTNLWTVHLTFAPEQLEAMEPKGGGFGGVGGPPGPGGGPAGGGPVGPGRSGPGAPGGPGGFGPAMFIAPMFMGPGDTNQDGALSKAEFEGLGRKWFDAWDTDHSGAVDLAKLRAGFNAGLMRIGPGGPRPGGPGGPARGPEMGLQGPEGKRNGVAAMAGIEFNYVHADLDFEGHEFRDVGVRYKGNGTFMESRGSLKRSFKIDLNQFVNGRHLGGRAVLNLHSCVTDASYMNEVLAFQLYRDAGIPAPRTAYARVFLTVPGKHERTFLGLYSLVENVDKHFLQQNFGTKRGALFKPVTASLFDYRGDNWAAYRQGYDPKVPLFEDQIARVIATCRLFTEAGDAEFNARVGEYIDIPQLARFLAVMVFLSDMDGMLGPGQNFYMYLHPKTQLFTFLPWDQDHSWGQFPMRGTAEQRENLSIQKPWERDNNVFLTRVFKVDAFQKEYRARLEEFRRTVFQPERFRRQVDELAAYIRPAVRAESEARLGRFDQVVAGKPVGPGGFGAGFVPSGPTPSVPARGAGEVLVSAPGMSGEERPRGFSAGGPGQSPGGPFGFGQTVKPIKTFASTRWKSITDQLAGKSEGQTIGGFGGPFGGPGRPGAGRGGPGEFGPGMFLGPMFLTAMDADKNGVVTPQELGQTLAKWFADWDKDRSGILSNEELRSGINQDLSPFRNGPPPGFGPPGFGPSSGGGPGAGPPDEQEAF
jgi:spore coat protein H